MMKWLIYGATGYTGRLVVEEAVRRGHRPVLAGRSTEKLAAIGDEFRLDVLTCDLRDPARLLEIVSGFDLVCHLAGPYVHTAEPMVTACLAGATSYLDITGEIPVLLRMEAFADEAEEKRIALIPACGFIAAPADCCARYVAEMLPKPVRLEMAVAPSAKLSAGTARSVLPMVADGILVRRGGELVHRRIGEGFRRVGFLDKERAAIPAPQADLVLAYRTTGVGDITSYIAVPRGTVSLIRAFGPAVQKMLSLDGAQRIMTWLVVRMVKGPDEEDRQKDRSRIWVRAEDESGEAAAVFLETLGSYPFTAHCVVRAAERILTERPCGLLTPAQAFGSDFVLEIPGTVRRDVREPD